MSAARGRAAQHAGRAAEETVARAYAARGGAILARRWRVAEGEIDLIVRLAETLVFVEVKARKGGDRAAIAERQWRRLEAAALRWLGEAGPSDAPALRFDAAFVGADGTVDLVENARSFDEW